jgi:hypothetical protein
MPFQNDATLEAEVGHFFGDYQGTFFSEPHGQVRADLFRLGDRLEAHVSFPTGLDADGVTDRYMSDLSAYARQKGFEGRLHLILS